MLERGVNSPLTSSCGRLFDAVAALVGLRERVNYEAQAAIELEMALPETPERHEAYPLAIVSDAGGYVLDTGPLFASLLDDLQRGRPVGTISQRFHDGLVEGFARAAVLLRERTALDRICLSGGCFQNAYLLEQMTSHLAAAGFKVFTHAEVPAGDGGLSLGQALVAAHRLR